MAVGKPADKPAPPKKSNTKGKKGKGENEAPELSPEDAKLKVRP